jgi:hypothetical protein
MATSIEMTVFWDDVPYSARSWCLQDYKAQYPGRPRNKSEVWYTEDKCQLPRICFNACVIGSSYPLILKVMVRKEHKCICVW